tara:strand:+ start:151 stop:1062 length:912 start_codon:yes stop_codon:yes gene_type:complete
MLIGIYFLSTWAGVASVQAQTSPEVSLTCQQPNAIDVFPGSTRTSIVYCTLSNPTAVSETVKITYSAGVLGIAGPGSKSVPGGGQSVSFEVALRAELRMPEGQQVVTITAEVTNWGGVTSGFASEPVESKVLAVFKQFSRLRVGAELAFLQLRPKVDYMMQFDVYNDGNARDKFFVEVQNYDELNDAGFQLSIPLITDEIESLAPPTKFRIQMRTPKNQGWTDKYYNLQFKATSDFSIRTEGIPNYQVQSMTIYIRGIYLPGFELTGTMMITALAAVALAGRSNERDEDSDYSELRPMDSRLF